MKVTSVITGASAALVAFQAALYASHGEADLLRPPGAHGEKDFASRCVKCGKCMEACPYIAIKPARDDAGAAVGTPMIDARAQACRLCEGDAIHSVFAPVIDEDKCVGCGLCVERCVVSEPRVAIRIASDEERAGGIEPSA